MDMSVFNGRKRAEDGIFLQLRHPFTDEPIEEKGEPVGFVVRGSAAPSVQARLKEMQKKVESADDDEDRDALMEAMHSAQIEGAMPFIISARNMELGDKPVETEEQIREILNMTFPQMDFAKDADGNVRQVVVKDDEGNETRAPQFDITNKTFAQQVIDAAQDGARFLGETSGG
ncbi:hypothetical protein QEZ52_00275 [Aliisedimentitalea scapharcae]|uniref:Uncharacterized protein n=1 Tax=Aliisedimentitalea scapharcae TaxID=1524259 RepID=A0ABZ2XUK5_9RHOB